ncbi:MAG: glycosyltransferase family 2 protein [Propionibacteriaceae bacterium]|nr:glycosyltransferase family 2 protein [Propionibacteriaceae bacterium]
MAWLTVVFPIYNADLWIGQAFESLTAQEGFCDANIPIRVICVDDCSTDGAIKTIEFVSRFPDRVTYVRTQETSGSPATPRNIGLMAVQTPFVSFIDQDDYLADGMYAKCHGFLDSHPEVPMVRVASQYFGDLSGIEPRYPPHIARGTRVIDLSVEPDAFRLVSNVNTGVWRRSAIGNVTFVDGQKMNEDRDFSRKVTKLNGSKFGFIAETLYYFRFRADESSLSGQNSAALRMARGPRGKHGQKYDINLVRKVEGMLDRDVPANGTLPAVAQLEFLDFLGTGPSRIPESNLDLVAMDGLLGRSATMLDPNLVVKSSLHRMLQAYILERMHGPPAVTPDGQLRVGPVQASWPWNVHVTGFQVTPEGCELEITYRRVSPLIHLDVCVVSGTLVSFSSGLMGRMSQNFFGQDIYPTQTLKLQWSGREFSVRFETVLTRDHSLSRSTNKQGVSAGDIRRSPQIDLHGWETKGLALSAGILVWRGDK